MYLVTVNNLTTEQVFSPVLAVCQRKEVSLFELGQEASEPLAALAEGRFDATAD